jgi:hypothetical protein
MTGKKIVKKTTRMTAITKKLPYDDFGKAVLEKTIRETRIDGAGINNRQSVQEYIGLLLDADVIIRRGQQYRVTLEARTPGQIIVVVESELRIPLVRDLLKRALAGIEGITIIDEGLTATESTQIEQAQTMFMSSVFDQSKKSGLVGHGLEITLLIRLDC